MCLPTLRLLYMTVVHLDFKNVEAAIYIVINIFSRHKLMLKSNLFFNKNLHFDTQVW